MAVQEPNPDSGKIKLTLWSVWPTWESWNWPGREGKDMQVDVYSKYPKVRLYLNNQLIGEQATTLEQKYKATFALPYAPGLLKAVGVENDKEVEAKTLTTAGNAAKINLKADRNQIKADGQDLSFVSIELTDEHGVLQPNADNRLQFKITGPGVIAGVDNAYLKDMDSYAANNRKAWHGRALVVIRSTHSSGDITLEVSSEHLPKTAITIKAE
jgi:beta-galactosidase